MALITNLKGATGSQGIQGIQGADGTPGNKYHNGTGAPSVQTLTKLAELTAAIAGDWYLDTSTEDLYVKVQAAGAVWLDTP